MADLQKLAEKGKDLLAGLERLAIELSVARIITAFLLFCDCFMLLGNGRGVLYADWSPGKEIPFGAVLLCIALFSLTMTVAAPLCLKGIEFTWYLIEDMIVDRI